MMVNLRHNLVLEGMNPCILKVSRTQKAANIQGGSNVLFKVACPTASMQVFVVHAVSNLKFRVMQSHRCVNSACSELFNSPKHLKANNSVYLTSSHGITIITFLNKA